MRVYGVNRVVAEEWAKKNKNWLLRFLPSGSVLEMEYRSMGYPYSQCSTEKPLTVAPPRKTPGLAVRLSSKTPDPGMACRAS